MASRLLLHRSLRPFSLAAIFLTSSLLSQPFRTRKPLLCNSPPYYPFNSIPASPDTPSKKSQVPLFYNGSLNPEAMKQISSGSLLGLVCGIGVSVFSKPLALLIGLLIVGVNMLELRGIHVIPYQRIQKYVKGVDLRSLVEDNIPRKIAFGTTFALAGFGSFTD